MYNTQGSAKDSLTTEDFHFQPLILERNAMETT